ncbi:MAG: hypothetical protein RMJ88_05130 [Thermogemmata sp.]|nr:hypothetical protein [Thermogemmata sp.]
MLIAVAGGGGLLVVALVVGAIFLPAGGEPNAMPPAGGPRAGGAIPPGITPGGGPPNFTPPGGSGRPPGSGGVVPPGAGGTAVPPGYPGANGPGGPDDGSGGVVDPPGGSGMPPVIPPGGNTPRFPPGGGSSVGPPGGIVPPPGPGGDVPGPPVGGGGGGIPPTVGNTGNAGRPALSGSADAKRKAMLEPFYAAAFDKAKGELLTFAPRVEKVRLHGSLNRYDVTNNFAPKGRYKLPHLVARAVIDDKQGLLYAVAARADNQMTIQYLAQQQGTHAAAVGDVAVYDLKPLYEGKVEDGTDVKPLAIIPFSAPNRYIRSLVLGEDGSQLYVLTTTVSGNRPIKSTLTVVNTATRKPVRNRDLPEPAGEMILSPDGKHLIVTELSGNGGAVRLLNTSDLSSVKSYPFRGTPLDLSVAPNGTIAVTVVTSVPAAGGNPRPGGGPPGRPGSGGVIGPGGAGGGGGIGGVSPLGPGGDAPVGGGAGIGAPMIGGGPQGGGGAANPQFQAQINFLSDKGVVELPAVTNLKASNNGYVKFSPDGKSLYVGSVAGDGLDIYDVADPDNPAEVKLRAAFRTAGAVPLRGYFWLSPDGKYLIFWNGPVVDTEDTGGGLGVPVGGPGGGFPGGLPNPGGGFPGGLPAPGGGNNSKPPTPPIPPAGGGGFPGGLPIPPGGIGGGTPPAPPTPPLPPNAGGGTGPLIPLIPGGPRPGGVPGTPPPNRPGGGGAGPGGAPPPDM